MQAVAAPGVDDSLGGPRPLGGPSCWQCGAVGGVHVLPCPAGSVVSGRGARAAHLPEHPWHGVRAGVRWAMAFSQDRALSTPPQPPPQEEACFWRPGERVASLLGCSSLPEYSWPRGVGPTGSGHGRSARSGTRSHPRPMPSVAQVSLGSRLLPEPWYPMGRLQPQPCRLVLAGRGFLGGACCVAGGLVTAVMFTSFRDVDVLMPTKR